MLQDLGEPKHIEAAIQIQVHHHLLQPSKMDPLPLFGKDAVDGGLEASMRTNLSVKQKE